jgi:hypothetical protein
MILELNEEESRLLAAGISQYLSNLREEIVKTEKHEWSQALHREEVVLNTILSRLTT